VIFALGILTAFATTTYPLPLTVIGLEKRAKKRNYFKKVYKKLVLLYNEFNSWENPLYGA
jgi:hypothetical protein